ADLAAEVAARDEDIAGADDQQAGELRVVVDAVRRVADREVHRAGHRVAALGPVDHAAGERPVALEADVRRAEPVAFRRAAALGRVGRGHDAPSISNSFHSARLSDTNTSGELLATVSASACAAARSSSGATSWLTRPSSYARSADIRSCRPINAMRKTASAGILRISAIASYAVT